MEGKTRYDGGCHCAAVRFSIGIDRHEAIDCNCSICTKKGFLHLIVAPDDFTLLTGRDVLRTYTFQTHVAKHTFCSVCGIHPFYSPRSHPDQVDVNLRCLDGDVLGRFTIRPFDGRNWEASIHQIC